MSNSNPSIIEARRDQIFPHLDATDIEDVYKRQAFIAFADIA